MAYNFNNPWAKNPWADNIWAKPEMVDKVLGENTQTTNLDEKPTTGIFVENVTKEKLERLAKRINLTTKALKVEIPLDTLNIWADEENKNGCLYCTHKFAANDAISTAFKYIFSNQVLFINKGYDEVPNYDEFKGPEGQWINIDQLSRTQQKEFFIYALTHPAREFLYAKERGIDDYDAAHRLTLEQDLKIFSQFFQIRYENSWFESMKKVGYIKNETTYKDANDSRTEIECVNKEIRPTETVDVSTKLLKYPAKQEDLKTGGTISSFIRLEFLKSNAPTEFTIITFYKT